VILNPKKHTSGTRGRFLPHEFGIEDVAEVQPTGWCRREASDHSR